MARSHIAGPAELSIPFVLDKNPTVVLVGSAGERLGGALMELLARTQSEQLRRLALAGWFSAPQIVWNKSTRRSAAGRGMVGPDG